MMKMQDFPWREVLMMTIFVSVLPHFGTQVMTTKQEVYGKGHTCIANRVLRKVMKGNGILYLAKSDNLIVVSEG